MAIIRIIVPFYNEVEGISPIKDAFRSYFEKSKLDAQLFFVNDGSSDGSLPEIEKVCQNKSSFHFISFEKNAGLSSTIKAGFDYSRTDCVGYIDTYLQSYPWNFYILNHF